KTGVFQMKQRPRTVSKIPTKKENTNKKRQEDGKETKTIDTSLLKKNDLTMILVGAGVITLLIFVIFFFSSGSKKDSTAAVPSGSILVTKLEKRLTQLEDQLMVEDAKTPDGGKTLLETAQASKKTSDFEPVKQRVERLETAFSVKFDSISDRLDKIEQSISVLRRSSIVTVKTAPAKKKVVTKTPVKKPVQKTVKKKVDKSMFHTVLKKETLYSISKKYNTTVAQLRKLNKLTEKSKIFPGDTLLIR
ncbi:MAG: LysM peptidoglycan-binding domain-containing protein, partial [Desulfobacteraceae bacterium]|nr:LysM peptidoglycan-binding domain-containing protein [Desulfobacteraceae bacterium]